MEERSNKTIMCSVLFLDIVEYSRKPVSGQISLKERFNSYLSEAIRDVPVTDRIILDTGDGAAINFLGDVEDALKAALSVRQSLLDENPDVEHPLLVRMGINLGPVRLVRDINGQPNIVGDGINVAQRIMGFSDAAQILVSRSYYDAVSRLSPHYAGMFHYQGSRTDKHVREHEVYAIGYPGDKTTLRGKSAKRAEAAGGPIPATMHRAGVAMEATLNNLAAAYRKASPVQRALYIGAAIVPLLLLVALLVNLRAGKTPDSGPQQEQQAEVASAAAGAGVDKPAGDKPDVQELPKVQERPKVQQKPKDKFKDKPKDKPKPAGEQAKPASQATEKPAVSKPAARASSGETRILVRCTAGTEVFVNGVRKGSVGSSPLPVKLEPGSYSVILSHSSGGIYTQNVSLSAGETVEIRPGFCK